MFNIYKLLFMIYTRYLIGLFLLTIHIVKIIIGEYFTMDWILIYWSRLGFIICSFFVVGCYLTPLRWKYNRIWFGFITLLHQTYFAVNYYSKSEICTIYKILIRSVAQIGTPLENATTIKIFRFSFSVDILKVYCNTFLLCWCRHGLNTKLFGYSHTIHRSKRTHKYQVHESWKYHGIWRY